MAKSKENKSYFPTKENINDLSFCVKNDIAFCIQRTSAESEKYYVVKYKPSDYKKQSYLRINNKIPASHQNRLKLNEYEAWNKVFEYYHKTKLNLEGKTEVNKKEYTKFVEIPKQVNNQIDLISMIEDVEKEELNKKQ